MQFRMAPMYEYGARCFGLPRDAFAWRTIPLVVQRPKLYTRRSLCSLVEYFWVVPRLGKRGSSFVARHWRQQLPVILFIYFFYDFLRPDYDTGESSRRLADGRDRGPVCAMPYWHFHLLLWRGTLFVLVEPSAAGWIRVVTRTAQPSVYGLQIKPFFYTSDIHQANPVSRPIHPKEIKSSVCSHMYQTNNTSQI